MNNIGNDEIRDGSVSLNKLDINVKNTLSTMQNGIQSNTTKIGSGALNTTNQQLIPAINEVFQRGNEIKQELVDSLVAKGVSASTSETFESLITKVRNISTGIPVATYVGDLAITRPTGKYLSLTEASIILIYNNIAYIADNFDNSTKTIDIYSLNLSTGIITFIKTIGTGGASNINLYKAIVYNNQIYYFNTIFDLNWNVVIVKDVYFFPDENGSIWAGSFNGGTVSVVNMITNERYSQTISAFVGCINYNFIPGMINYHVIIAVKKGDIYSWSCMAVDVRTGVTTGGLGGDDGFNPYNISYDRKSESLLFSETCRQNGSSRTYYLDYLYSINKDGSTTELLHFVNTNNGTRINLPYSINNKISLIGFTVDGNEKGYIYNNKIILDLFGTPIFATEDKLYTIDIKNPTSNVLHIYKLV